MKSNAFLLILSAFLFLGFTSKKLVPHKKQNHIKKAKNWLLHMQQPNGLLESAEHTNFVSLYDNSLAALAFIATGKSKNAEKIFDFYNSRINHELLANSGGFYQCRDKNGANGNRTWMGDNAWLLIALNNYHAKTKNNRYKTLAKALEQWLRSLQDTDGGLWGGHNEDGTRIHKITEGIITAFNAVEGYDSFHKNILRYLKEERWNTKDQLLVAWPNNPNYYYAMDLHALGYLILEDFPKETLTKANRYLNTQITTATNTKITGYCFDGDKDVIWLEGSAQMALAYKRANSTSKAKVLLKDIEKTFITSSLNNNTSAIPYTSNQGTNFGTEILWNHTDELAAVSSTAWYIFAKKNFNPFTIEGYKHIPEADKFWLRPKER